MKTKGAHEFVHAFLSLFRWKFLKGIAPTAICGIAVVVIIVGLETAPAENI